jgi:hypothetical protein
MVFELRKSVHRTKSYDQKNKENAHFFTNPNFRPKNFKLVYLGQNLTDFLNSFFKNTPN